MALQLPPGSSLWVVALADAALYSHITGGIVGLVSGATALAARKGSALHRSAGNVYFIAMLVMAAIGAVVAPMLPQRPSMVAGALAFYLTATGWMTVRRNNPRGMLACMALLLAIATAALGARFAWQGLSNPSGELDGQPAAPVLVFAVIAAVGAVCDLKVIWQGGINGVGRIARHLWRMCFALLLATVSFFLGQQQLMPTVVRGSPVLFVLAAAPLFVLLYWLVRVRLGRRFKDFA